MRGDNGGNGGKGDGAEASLERPQLAFPWLSKFSSNLNSRLSFGADYTDSHAPKKSRTEQKRETALRRPSRTIRRTHARERAEEAGLRGLNRFGRNPTAVGFSFATEVCSNPNSRLYPHLSKRVTSPNHRSGSDRLREVGQLTSCGGPRCSPLRPTSRREATRASHGRNTGTRASPAPRRGRPTHRGRSVLDVRREESSLL